MGGIEPIVRRVAAARLGGLAMHGVIQPERHFPEPWSVEQLDACFVVKDLNGQALAYMYFEKESLHRHRRSELLTLDEARRIAAIFAKLPELLGKTIP
jgi:hypothetical protein